jgi:hypothetical protein
MYGKDGFLLLLDNREDKKRTPTHSRSITPLEFFPSPFYNIIIDLNLQIVIVVAQWRFKIALPNEEEQTIKMKEAVRRRRKS